MEGRTERPEFHVAHRLLRARDWQDRPQLSALCDWWRDGFGGVCALVGIGGAGKTAVADRFLRSLPGILPTPEVPTDPTLTPPRGLFVFSFYDAPNPDSFFTELAKWLADAPAEASVSYERTRRRLEREEDLLLVLDGLEKVQDAGKRTGHFGRLLDGRLRDLVLRAAEGYLPGTRLLITSRFRLFDALVEGSPQFRQIPVEDLAPEAALALLQQRGVRGTKAQLRTLARDQGFHALSLDLLGGYVARFCDGDPARLPAEAGLPVEAEPDAALDPQVAAIRLQERRFARLAERYAESLREADPATLALLQRVCLFRLGVDAATLASIFTGEGKEEVGGPELARLDEAGVRARLDLLTEMKLLDREEDDRYSVHPAVRDGFLQTLDEETSRRGHEAAREGLEVSLGARPEENPSDPATLDLLEEIVHHTLAAGHLAEAWDIYWSRIGNFKHLGYRVGAYERGERICRAFAGGRFPEEMQIPESLAERQRSQLVNDWALYLKYLGHTRDAVLCYRQAITLDEGALEWGSASVVHHNFSRVLELAGRLAAAVEAGEEALRLADRIADAERRRDSFACLAHARALHGETSAALQDFADALYWQRAHEKISDRPLWGLPGVQRALLQERLGRSEEATRMVEGNLEIVKSSWGLNSPTNARCELFLADRAREHGDLASAEQLLEAAQEWAIARDAKEFLCWAMLVRTRLERDRLQSAGRPSSADAARGEPSATARRAVEEGLRIARDCGYGLYHVDLLLLRARLSLEAGDADAALTDVETALFQGVRPPEESGLPELLAATDPECGYAWGEAEGRHLRGEVLLTQAARRLRRTDFAPARFDDIPEEVRELVTEARRELEMCRELRRKIQDPKVADTEEVLRQLEGGVLTRHPVEPPTPREEPPAPGAEEIPPPKERRKRSPKKHLFLSYVRETSADVARLRDDLIHLGETVWWDQDIRPGAVWKREIRRALKDAYAFVLCLSKELEGRDLSGAFPEIRDAIAIHRQVAPDGSFIFPVRLSDCRVPSFEIDATTSLEDLQHTDLFPESKRTEALERLAEALRARPGHP